MWHTHTKITVFFFKLNRYSDCEAFVFVKQHRGVTEVKKGVSLQIMSHKHVTYKCAVDAVLNGESSIAAYVDALKKRLLEYDSVAPRVVHSTMVF